MLRGSRIAYSKCATLDLDRFQCTLYNRVGDRFLAYGYRKQRLIKRPCWLTRIIISRCPCPSLSITSLET
jgi:hypothetical protein